MREPPFRFQKFKVLRSLPVALSMVGSNLAVGRSPLAKLRKVPFQEPDSELSKDYVKT